MEGVKFKMDNKAEYSFISRFGNKEDTLIHCNAIYRWSSQAPPPLCQPGARQASLVFLAFLRLLNRLKAFSLAPSFSPKDHRLVYKLDTQNTPDTPKQQHFSRIIQLS